MTADRPKRLRCAIYTRKSSEEGLEQAFNSLDAQREACEAYIKSQAGRAGTSSAPATTTAALGEVGQGRVLVQVDLVR